MSRFHLGGIPIDFLSPAGAVEKVKEFLSEPEVQKPRQIVTINSLMFNCASRDEELRRVMQEAPLVVPDSIGIVAAGFLMRAADAGALRRIPGIDLMLDVCDFARKNGLSVFLLGAKPEVIPETAMALKKRLPGLTVAGFYHGYFGAGEEEKVIGEINDKKPDILFVGFDIPRQEKWIHSNLTRLNVRVVMGVGGSFDVISGKLKRAPALMRAAGLEWLFRFLQEPWRIVRIKDLPVFLVKIIRIRFCHG
jgi:N-acetylglucosaminyldiphosphoundecaprenol N-acetyl-beta-D-mannosaminyltransferase